MSLGLVQRTLLGAAAGCLVVVAAHPMSRPYLLDGIRRPPALVRPGGFPTQALKLPDPTNPSRAALWLTSYAVGADGGRTSGDDLLLLAEIAQAGAAAEPANGFWLHMMSLIEEDRGNRKLAADLWRKAAGCNRWHSYPEAWKGALAAGLQRHSGRPMGWHAPVVESQVQRAMLARMELQGSFYGVEGRGYAAAIRALTGDLGWGGVLAILCAAAGPALLSASLALALAALVDALLEPKADALGRSWAAIAAGAALLAGGYLAGGGAAAVSMGLAGAAWFGWGVRPAWRLGWLAVAGSAALAASLAIGGQFSTAVWLASGMPAWVPLAFSCAAGAGLLAALLGSGGAEGLDWREAAAMRRGVLLRVAGACCVASALAIPVCIALDQPLGWQTALLPGPN